MARAKRAPKSKTAESYQHPEADSPMRPEVGTQAQFKKKKPPQTYRYDSSLSPSLEWDGQNPAREQGEAAIAEIVAQASRLRVDEASAPRRPSTGGGTPPEPAGADACATFPAVKSLKEAGE